MSGRVLVVDADPAAAGALRERFEGAGLHVSAETSPQEALQRVRKAAPDVVVAAFDLPGVDGAQLLGRMWASAPHAERVLLAGDDGFETCAQAVNEGHVHRLLRPRGDEAELLRAVRAGVQNARLRRERDRLLVEVAIRNGELEQSNARLEALVEQRTRRVLEAIVSALDFRDTETHLHSQRVAAYARRLGEAMGLSPAELQTLETGALLHDVGKIGVRDAVLLKRGGLTPAEWAEMRTHPALGHRLLRSMDFMHDAALIVLQHQERWDGRGYPQGLRGDEIVLGARVFAVVDAFDAMSSDRPYRRGCPLDQAIAEIARCSGTQFDPAVVRAFMAVPPIAWLDVREQVEQRDSARRAAEADAAPTAPPT